MISSHLALTSGDETRYERDNVHGVVLSLPPEESAYTLTYDQTRKNAAFHQSLTTHTQWDFGSAHSGERTVPEPWPCVADSGQYGDSTACSALPLLIPHYTLGAAPDGTSPTGADHLDVAFRHAPGTSSSPAVTKATVEVSFDGGEKWTKATTTATGEGAYRAEWTNPDSAAGKDVTLRVAAVDADGQPPDADDAGRVHRGGRMAGRGRVRRTCTATHRNTRNEPAGTRRAGANPAPSGAGRRAPRAYGGSRRGTRRVMRVHRPAHAGGVLVALPSRPYP